MTMTTNGGAETVPGAEPVGFPGQPLEEEMATQEQAPVGEVTGEVISIEALVMWIGMQHRDLDVVSHALSSSRPNMFAHPLQKLEHEGKLREIVGARNMLNKMSKEFVGSSDEPEASENT